MKSSSCTEMIETPRSRTLIFDIVQLLFFKVFSNSGSPPFVLNRVLSEPQRASGGFRICQQPAASALRLTGINTNGGEPKFERPQNASAASRHLQSLQRAFGGCELVGFEAEAL